MFTKRNNQDVVWNKCTKSNSYKKYYVYLNTTSLYNKSEVLGIVLYVRYKELNFRHNGLDATVSSLTTYIKYSPSDVISGSKCNLSCLRL